MGVPLIGFSFQDGQLLLTVNLFDEFNQLILQIHENELRYKPSPWDIEFEGTHLRLREAARKFLLEIDFHPPNMVMIPRGRFLLNGAEVLVTLSGANVSNGPTVSHLTMARPGAGVVIGPSPQPIFAFLRMPNVSRYPSSDDRAHWISDTFGAAESE